jgi:hypothetical protein
MGNEFQIIFKHKQNVSTEVAYSSVEKLNQDMILRRALKHAAYSRRNEKLPMRIYIRPIQRRISDNATHTMMFSTS